MKRISTPLAPTLSPTFNPVSDDYFTAWGLVIYGNDSKYSDFDPISAANTLEVCSFFKLVGETSDQSLKFWKWHVCDLYKINEKDHENTIKVWKDLFISKTKEMQQIVAKCENFYSPKSWFSRTISELVDLLDPVKDIALYPKANKKVQYHIAYLYAHLLEGEDGRKEALKYYKLSARQGHVDAQYELALYYVRQYEDKDDLFFMEKALNFFELAANQEHILALEELGYCYKSGNGCSIDLKNAFECYKKLADLGGNADYVAECYKNGNGVFVNFEEALKYFKMGADQGYKAKKIVSLWKEHGIGGASDRYIAQVEKGNFKSKLDLIKKYEYGIALATNFDETVKFYDLAKELGSYGYVPKINFYYKLGLCHEKGSIVNLQKAFACYYKAAPFDQLSSLALARCYADGIGTDVNDEEAIRFFKVYFKQNKFAEVKEHFTDLWIMTDSDAFLEKATCHEYGYGTPSILKEAIKYYKLAAEALKKT